MMIIDPEGLVPKVTGVGQSGKFVEISFPTAEDAEAFARVFKVAVGEACLSPTERYERARPKTGGIDEVDLAVSQAE